MRTDRRRSIKALAAGGLAGWLAQALAQGAVERSGLVKASGEVLINGKPAQAGQPVTEGDTVSTGRRAEAVYVMGKNAFLVRGDSTVSHSGEGASTAMRVLTGKVLSVFGSGVHRIETATATAGIRGTACYLESEPERVYFCLCYGGVELVPLADPAQVRAYQSVRHDTPFYIDKASSTGLIRPAPGINHRDFELVMLEALVGRKVPFPMNEGKSLY